MLTEAAGCDLGPGSEESREGGDEREGEGVAARERRQLGLAQLGRHQPPQQAPRLQHNLTGLL